MCCCPINEFPFYLLCAFFLLSLSVSLLFIFYTVVQFFLSVSLIFLFSPSPLICLCSSGYFPVLEFTCLSISLLFLSSSSPVPVLVLPWPPHSVFFHSCDTVTLKSDDSRYKGNVYNNWTSGDCSQAPTSFSLV